MRQDQFEKLQALSEKLTDVFLEEAEPANWPGHGLKPDQMTAQTRGDRYWSKKGAAATLVLIGRIHGLTDIVRHASAAGDGSPAAVTEPADEMDKEIAAAEKEAAKLLNQAQQSAKKAAFDKHVHGKS